MGKIVIDEKLHADPSGELPLAIRSITKTRTDIRTCEAMRTCENLSLHTPDAKYSNTSPIVIRNPRIYGFRLTCQA
ncbi:MAG: hypothetical protein M2R45_03831 [Verrucomicrobia subdivision 3 bacterium]|nr:hypothetical protein [Limisphaerales bacterium]MCS1415787.1 hypothetical protein [Limisphaerales bacterium]